MSWSLVEFAEEKWESVRHFILKSSSSAARNVQHQVFDDAIKIATSLVVCFLQSQFHHRWQHHGAIFIKKIKPESPRSSAGVLSHNTPAVLHQIQAIFTENCSSKSRLSLFQHGHPNGWSPTMGKSVAWHNDDTIRIYASSMPPSMQSFESVILLQVQGVLYLYYW
jgi:hypothetical protein